MCHLTTVVGTFHGRVLAARLGAEGVAVVLRGASDGPYPIQSTVDVLVPADQLMFAREILLADSVDDIFRHVAPYGVSGPGPGLGDDGSTALQRVSPETSGSSAAGPKSGVPSLRSEVLGSLEDPSERRSAREGSPAGQRYRPHGPSVVLIVLVTVMMIVVGCVAAIVH